MLCKDSLFIDRVITVGETYAYHHDPASKCESSEWKISSLPSLKKIHQIKSTTIVLLYAFFDKDGVIYQYIIRPNTTVTTDAFIKILKNLCWHLWSKHSGLTCSFILHLDNAHPGAEKTMLEYPAAKRSLCCHTHPTVQIYPLVIFACSKIERTVEKPDIFYKMRTSSWPAIRYLLVFRHQIH